jgi:hypothetical protein
LGSTSRHHVKDPLGKVLVADAAALLARHHDRRARGDVPSRVGARFLGRGQLRQTRPDHGNIQLRLQHALLRRERQALRDGLHGQGVGGGIEGQLDRTADGGFGVLLQHPLSILVADRRLQHTDRQLQRPGGEQVGGQDEVGRLLTLHTVTVLARLQRGLLDRHGDDGLDGRFIGGRAEPHQRFGEQFVVHVHHGSDFDILAGDVLDQPNRIEDRTGGDVGRLREVRRHLDRCRVEGPLAAACDHDDRGHRRLTELLLHGRRGLRLGQAADRHTGHHGIGGDAPRRPQHGDAVDQAQRCRDTDPDLRAQAKPTRGCCCVLGRLVSRFLRHLGRCRGGRAEVLGKVRLVVGLTTLGAFVLGHGPTPSTQDLGDTTLCRRRARCPRARG